MIHVIAELHLAPGTREHFAEELRRLTPLVQAEAGCIEYRGTVEVPTGIGAQAEPRRDVVTVIEKWESEEALAAHLVAPHMLEWGARVGELMTARVIRVLQDV